MKEMDQLFSEFCTPKESEEKCKCIVRLITSHWHDPDGIYEKKSLKFLKRKCNGFNIISEDAGYVGASEVVKRITNLDICEDGIYEVVICNEFSAWETPHIVEDYDYKLVPFAEPEIKKVDSSS